MQAGRQAGESESKRARTIRRQLKLLKLKYSKRDTSKYQGVGAGGGASAKDKRKG